MSETKSPPKDKIEVSDPSSTHFHHEHLATMPPNPSAWTTREPYGPPGFAGLFTNNYVAMCALFATIGGLLFGYEYIPLPTSQLSPN